MTLDNKIIRGCIKGKRSAQNRLYKKFSTKMYSVCLRYCAKSSEAEDVLQEGFIKVFTNIQKVKDYKSLEAWIQRIMINTAISSYHKNLKHHFHEDIDNIRDLGEIYHFEVEENEVFNNISPEELVNIIDELPKGYKIVLNLYVIEEYSHKEISKTLKISESTSKSQLSRARKILRQKAYKLKNEELKPVYDEK